MRRILRVAGAACGVGISGAAHAVEWDVSLWGERRAFTEHVERLAEIVEERSDGTFTLNLSYGELSPNIENLEGIAIGAFEMAQFCAGYHRDRNLAITVLELPVLGVEDLEQEVAVSHAVYGHPAVVDEMARSNARILMTSPMPQYNVAGTGDPRATIAAMDGMRVRATGGVGEVMQAVGAVPTAVTATETYEAMQTGAVDAAAFAPHAHLSFGVTDVADWWTENLNPGTANCPVVVNIDAYDALSDEHRAILDAAVDEAIAHYLDNYAALLGRWDETLAAKGVEAVHLPPAEIAKLRSGAEPIHLAWIADATARGLPGRELYDLVQGVLAKSKGF